MPMRIEDYAMIGDCRTAALVAKNGSIDWFCAPRFDSGACFAALLGKDDNGRWKLAPQDGAEITKINRRYRPGSMVLETEFETPTGAVRVTDAMAIDTDTPTIVRMVEGLRGEVPMQSSLAIRFDYGWIVPWVTEQPSGISAVAGPDMLQFRSWVEHHGEDFQTVGRFVAREGQKIPFTLAWHSSTNSPPPGIDAEAAIRQADAWWRDWSSRCRGQFSDDPDTDQATGTNIVVRSLLTLKALTYAPTGGIAAAATTSLPEKIGGVRNWDYRFCWLRDATFTLLALVSTDYLDEARQWRNWLLRAAAGRPDHLQIMYGLAGERRLTEIEIDWLDGYESSKPVRIGNAASTQFQLDVYGEVADAFFHARKHGLVPLDNSWNLNQGLLEYLATIWQQPDDGIWEVRGERQHFTHSKVMAWVAFDRAIRAVEESNFCTDHLDEWKRVRQTIHQEVCEKGFDAKQSSFVQHYGSSQLDASLLMIPLVGFLPADDPRMKGTVTAIEKQLMEHGFVHRYLSDETVEGLPGGEGVFLPCTFWLADNLALQGRHDEARDLFNRVVAVCNDVGLLAEEYDPVANRQLGNFPQAFSHVCLVNTAQNLARNTNTPNPESADGAEAAKRE